MTEPHASADPGFDPRPGSLRASLRYEPRVLRFGTSGRRGEVRHLTQLEVYLNARAELDYLLSLPADRGGIRSGDAFYLAHDLRPSSIAFSPEQGGRGELAQAIEQAIRDAGLVPVNLGPLPTPALSAFALERRCGSMMVTGSHIPFDRNGYKTNGALGELLKQDEAPVNEHVSRVRERLYTQAAVDSPFDAQGMFKSGHRELSLAQSDGRQAYLQRYLDFIPSGALRGLRLLVYQHSAVGRDLLVELLAGLGAEAVPAGRSDTFVPIDTENIDHEQLAVIQALADDAGARHGPLEAIVSTDGDSDRPLLLGIDPDRRVRFFGGDLVGMIVAEFLEADAVVVPISCNDAIDRGPLRDRLQPKTRIGSPYVIEGMDAARRRGARTVCGWEANGGFLLGSDVERGGRRLRALPTRDAFLPILAVLLALREARTSLVELFSRLPARSSKAALLKNFPRAASLALLARFSPANPTIRDAWFEGGSIRAADPHGSPVELGSSGQRELLAIRHQLGRIFTPAQGFGGLARVNLTDGLRLYFENGDVAHIRPSGNADELRIYAVADSAERAEGIARLGVAEPDGLLRQLARIGA